MLAVMQWIETPIAVNELVFHLSNLMQHGDVAVISTEELAADQKPIFEPRSTDDPAGEVIALDGFRKEYAAWNDAMRAVVLLGTTRTMLIQITEGHSPVRELTQILERVLKISCEQAEKKAIQAWADVPMSNEDIARLLQTPLNNVEVMRSRALSWLYRRYSQLD